MKQVTVTVEARHIERAIEAVEENSPLMVGERCPMWQAVTEMGLFMDRIVVGSSVIWHEDYLHGATPFRPPLPEELYTTGGNDHQGWRKALERAKVEPYVFTIEVPE